MAQRATYPSSPSSSSVPTFAHHTPSPPRSSSAQSRHQAQLANYKRDPVRAAAASRKQHRLSRSDSDYTAGPRNGGFHHVPVDREGGGMLSSFWSRAYHLYLPAAFMSVRSKTKSARVKRYLSFVLLAAVLYYLFGSYLPSPRSLSGPKAHEAVHPAAKKTPLRQRPTLPSHVLARSHSDHPVTRGQLRVDMDSKIHPIYQLIRDGREQWDTKVANQSKTLSQAVAEYKKRYKRNPPKGFDKWWDYVVENNVQLPDEYDQIDHDIWPFFALSPRDLQKRVEAESLKPDVFTLRLRRGAIRTTKTYDPDEIEGADARLEGQVELLRPVAKYIDDFTAVYSVHDTPSKLLSWDHRAEIIDHIEDNEYLDQFDEVDTSISGWQATCPHESRLRQVYQRSDFVDYHPALPDTSLDRKTFIQDHRVMMDVCENPMLIPLHGLLAGKTPSVNPLEPRFSLSKTGLHADIVGVPTEQFAAELPAVPWGERNGEKLLWRGSTTGATYDVDSSWWATHRCRLVALGDDSGFKGREDGVHLLLAPKLMKGYTIERSTEHYDYDQLNEHYTDLAFVGEPLQCSKEDGTCADLNEEYRWEDRMSVEQQSRYKYIIDTDGNAWSARFQRLMISGSLIFKSTIMTEWWTDRIQPWVHYVPIQMDYSDVYDALAFFRGDLKSRGGEPDLARDIAQAGRDWALNYYRKEDMIAYVFRLYLEWARLMSDKRSQMDYVSE